MESIDEITDYFEWHYAVCHDMKEYQEDCIIEKGIQLLTKLREMIDNW